MAVSLQTNHRVGPWMRNPEQPDDFVLLGLPKSLCCDPPIEHNCSCGITESFFVTHVFIDFHLSEAVQFLLPRLLDELRTDLVSGDVVKTLQADLVWVAYGMLIKLVQHTFAVRFVSTFCQQAINHGIAQWLPLGTRLSHTNKTVNRLAVGTTILPFPESVTKTMLWAFCTLYNQHIREMPAFDRLCFRLSKTHVDGKLNHDFSNWLIRRKSHQQLWLCLIEQTPRSFYICRIQQVPITTCDRINNGLTQRPASTESPLPCSSCREALHNIVCLTYFVILFPSRALPGSIQSL